jgi:hypothetical protein
MLGSESLSFRWSLTQEFSMRPRLLLTVLILLWVAGPMAPPARAADDVTPDQSMRMYRDPQTGAVGRPSAAALQAESADRTTAPAALVAPAQEEAVQAPAGGVKVNLRGTHRPAVVRFADPGHPVVHECVDGVDPAHE